MSSAEPVFRGVGVALVTLFNSNGTPDAAATAAHAARVVDRGVRSVLVAGTTGEFWALSETGRVELIRAVKSALPVEIPVLAGTGASDTQTAVRLTSAAVDAGVAAVLVLAPPGATEVHDYYAAVAEAAGDRPLLGYHIPAISSPGLQLDQLATLPIQGIKDSSIDPRRLLEELDILDGHVITGVDSLLSYAGPLGCAGALGALANVEPELSIAAFAGDASAQRRLAPIERAALEAFPLGLKKLLHAQEGTSIELGPGTATLAGQVGYE
jgi:4-hydroxy-tetrahydrodipicolinate synthase